MQAPAFPAPPEPLANGSSARPELRGFLNWLGCWIVLPNLPFLPVTLMGGPPRVFDIMLCGITGLIARRLPFVWQLAVFLGLLTYLTLAFIAAMFNMAPSMLLSVIGLVFDLKPQNSPEYLAGSAFMVAVIAGAAWMLRRSSAFSHPRWLLSAIALTSSLAAGDYALSRSAFGSYTRYAANGAPFTSASTQTRLIERADGRTNVLVVVVEAMGQPVDPALRAKLAGMWLRPELAGRYELSQGLTDYYGSTTSGELRELCQRWGDYRDIAAPQPGCLPARFARLGYQTSSIHAFEASFFDRPSWYPLIGIQQMSWGQDLMRQGVAPCPTVFAGACDRDVPALIGRRIKAADKPQFVYWLTLNSHLPVEESKQLGTANCRQLGPVLDDDLPMVCRLFAIWGDTSAALAKMLADPDLPPTDVLIVGDHMPPFTLQRARVQFAPDQVPWFYLRHKGGVAKAQSSPL
jgi:hypothetical protein